MGYMSRHAIVVTSWDKRSINTAHQKANKLFEGILKTTEITPEVTNGYRSFLIPPDGSKEGWSTSDLGDKARDKFINWLSSNKSNYCQYAEVNFADENGYNGLLRSS